MCLYTINNLWVGRSVKIKKVYMIQNGSKFFSYMFMTNFKENFNFNCTKCKINKNYLFVCFLNSNYIIISNYVFEF